MTLHQEAATAAAHPSLTSPAPGSAAGAGAGEASGGAAAWASGQAGLRRKASGAVRGGLRLSPASDWLWSCAGMFAAADAAWVEQHGASSASGAAAATAVTSNVASAGKGGSDDVAGLGSAQKLLGEAEFCMGRALQLNPKRAATWAALGRLYASKGFGTPANRCFEQSRAQEPRLVAVWEAMAFAAGIKSKVRMGPNMARCRTCEHVVPARLAFPYSSIP